MFEKLNKTQTEIQQTKDLTVEQRTDEGKTDKSSDIRKKKSSKISKEDGKDGLGCSVETFKNIEGRYDKNVDDFMLLYECTLILQKESDNYCKIYSFITWYKSRVKE